MINFDKYELVAYQVQQEELQKLQQRVEQLKKTRFKLHELSPKEICDLLDAETDVDESGAMMKQLSNSVQQKIQLVRDERNADIILEINRKMGEQEQNLSRMIRFRVVDAKTPNKTGVITWWSPTDDLLEGLKEGRVIEVMNSSSVSQGKEILINAGKSSEFRVISSTASSETFEKFYRPETRFDEFIPNFAPPHDEFDVACVVVHIIEADKERKNEWQKIYVADENVNLMCLNFWSSLADCAFDDVVAVGQIFYAKNLQWRFSQASSKIPQAFIDNENTLLVVHPKQINQKHRMEQLRETIGNDPEFIIKCNAKIAELDLCNATINSKSTSLNKENRSLNACDRTIIENHTKVTPVIAQRPVFPKTVRIVKNLTPNISSTERLQKTRLGVSSTKGKSLSNSTSVGGTKIIKSRPTFNRSSIN